MRKQVEEVLEGIRKTLRLEGGDIELVELDEEKGLVKVRLLGACAGCPASQLTLKALVETQLKRVRGVKEVRAI